MREATIALGAIPNTGKTTVFNRLTGTNQSVGNWPGVTVEKKIGHFSLDGYAVHLVDLPGAYSITPTSLEERIVRDYFLESPPDLILNIVDACNLYRGLGLTLQLAMSGVSMVVALNMMDEAKRSGIEFDITAFSQHLGIPVVPLIARRGEGIAKLKLTLLEMLQGKYGHHRPPRISFQPVLEHAIVDLAREIQVQDGYPPFDHSFVAIRLLEGGEATERLVRHQPPLQKISDTAAEQRVKLEQVLGTSVPTACAQCRFNAAKGLIREVTRRRKPISRSATEKIDNVLLHRFFGLPIFFLIMLVVFQGVFYLGVPLQQVIALQIGNLQKWLWNWPGLSNLPTGLSSFLIEGIINGCGVVVSFVPLIALFFVFLSLIEDTGYMARAAFLMDRLMHGLRLDGKAFISLLLGYGCNVPAILGTRILPSQHSRILTMLLIPFSLCTARLQVFVFLSGILFTATSAPWVVFSLYVASFLIIVLAGILLRPLRFGGAEEPFIMELPPYRLPLLRTVSIRAWREIKGFISRAATLIIAGVVIVWFLTNYPTDVAPGSIDSFAGRVGTAVSFVFEPIGIGWQETIALMFGFIAKEIVIGAMAVIYGGGTDTAAQIAAHLTPLRGLSFMVFVLIYTPCVATVAVIRSESRSWKFTLLSVLFSLGLAWSSSFVIYWGGNLLGFQ